MANPINTIVVGSTPYDVQAKSLATACTVDGVAFDGTSNIGHYAVCNTAASTVNKEVTLTGFDLAAGARIAVKFTNANTTNNPQLKVNSLAAKPIMTLGSTAALSGAWEAGELVEFEYDGTNFIIKGVTNGAMGAALANYLPLDGYSENATVGNAEQLVSTVFVNDKAAYNFRPAGGNADIGDRVYNTFVGSTLFWNQQCNNTPSSATPSGTSTYSTITRSFSMLPYDVVLYRWKISYSGTNATEIFGRQYPSGSAPVIGPTTVLANDAQYYTIIKCEPNKTGISIAIRGSTNLDPTADAWSMRDIEYFDLSLIFGRKISEYIYNSELTNSGSGYSIFTSLFPKKHYARNTGTFLSVNISDYTTVGFNAYNHSTTSAELLGGYDYQITGAYTTLSYTDIDGNTETITPDADGYFTPAQNGILTVTDGDSTTTCVHLVWDGERDGDWEEYTEHDYPLDSSATLLGTPMLSASNEICYDGDTYASDGTITRNYSLVAGTEFAKSSITSIATQDGYTKFWISAVSKSKTRGNMLCNKAPFDDDASLLNDMNRMGIGRSNTNSYPGSFAMVMLESDVGSTQDSIYNYFQNSGIEFIFKVSNPATESATSFIAPQIIDDFGTEKCTDYAYSQGTRDVAIPVGHNSQYSNNLRAKLEMAPNNPSGDGDYIVRQANGTNVYAKLVIPNELPTIPSTDGTYTLTATIVDGEATLSWVSAT